MGLAVASESQQGPKKLSPPELKVFFPLSFLSRSHRRAGKEDIKGAWVLNFIFPFGETN